MPYTTINTSFVVPSEQAHNAHERMDAAIDQLLLHNLNLANTEITEECADPPDETD